MTTLAKAKHNAHERSIARQLDLSDAQLDGLLRIRAGYWPGNAAAVLERKGLAWRDLTGGASGLTPAGEELLRRARQLGF